MTRKHGDGALEELSPEEMEYEQKENYEHYKRVYTLWNKSQEGYDKALLLLSSGAIAVTFSAFGKEIIQSQIQNFILICFSWVFWTLSLVIILVAYVTSREVMKKEICQLNDELEGIYEKIRPKKRKGSPRLNKVTQVLNYAGGGTFIVGLILMIVFLFTLSSGSNQNENGKEPVQIKIISETTSSGQVESRR